MKWGDAVKHDTIQQATEDKFIMSNKSPHIQTKFLCFSFYFD